jgi:predicted phage terminase large subunit-like protein
MSKNYSFEELLRSPDLRTQLTTPQLQDFLNRLKKLSSGLGRPSAVPDDFEQFCLSYSHNQWRSAKHLRFLIDHLHQLHDRKITRLLVSMPPRHGKSFTIDKFFPAWWLAKHPSDRIILTGYGEQFARRWGGSVRDLIIEYSDQWNLQLNPRTTASDDWELTSGGGMLCVGAGGALMGRGADLFILDDVVKSAEEAESEVYREKIWDWFQASATTRLQPNAVMVGVMTRWHQDDLFGRIIDNYGDDWTVINLPAVAEEEDPLGRAPGEGLWPEFWGDPDYYRKQQESRSPFWFSALYQGRPTPEGGGILMRDWWQFYHSTPSDFDQMIQSWDLALKDKATNDYSVGQVWGRKGADLYLLGQVRGHFSLHEVANHMRMFTVKYPRAVAKLVEDTAMGPAIKQTLTHEVPGIIPFPAKGSKKSRVEASVPLVQAGNVFLPENDQGVKAKWVWEFIEECAAFPRGANDDQVDAFTQAATYILPHSWRQLRQAAREAAELEEMPNPRDLRTKWFNEKVDKWRQKADRSHAANCPPLIRRKEIRGW